MAAPFLHSAFCILNSDLPLHHVSRCLDSLAYHFRVGFVSVERDVDMVGRVRRGDLFDAFDLAHGAPHGIFAATACHAGDRQLNLLGHGRIPL